MVLHLFVPRPSNTLQTTHYVLLGLDDDNINEELELEPTESMLVDAFQDMAEFPGAEGDHESPDRKTHILKILNECTDPNSFTDDDEKYDSMKVEASDFDISQQDHDESMEVHSKMCPGIFDKGMFEDAGLLHMLSVGYKKDRPYMSYLNDMYSRDQVAMYHQQNGKSYDSAAEWAEANKHMARIKKLGVIIGDNGLLKDVTKAIARYQRKTVSSAWWVIFGLISRLIQD